MTLDERIVSTIQGKVQHKLIRRKQWPQEGHPMCRFQLPWLRWNHSSDCQCDPRYCHRSHHTGPVRRHAWRQERHHWHGA